MVEDGTRVTYVGDGAVGQARICWGPDRRARAWTPSRDHRQPLAPPRASAQQPLGLTVFVQLAGVQSISLLSRDVRKSQEMIYVNCFKLFFFFLTKKGRKIKVLIILSIQP